VRRWSYRQITLPRLPRSLLEDGFFHATARANHGLALFVDDLDRLDFLQLRSTVELYDWRCHAHCLMGTHYHLVLEVSRTRLSEGMRRLNGTYSRRYNRRHGHRGHLFEERFSSFVIRDERHLYAAVEYVLQNPVRAGLCAHARDWQWSAGAAFA
jgi:REP-associated tyrosine transposase